MSSKPDPLSDFDKAASSIEQYYNANSTGMGWRFAYGPRAALLSEPHLWFLGLNPGGSGPDIGEVSREDGNGYRLEGWSERGHFNPLQNRVHGLFKRLGSEMGKDWAQLLDQCFTANACPFRTPSEGELSRTMPNWEEFSARLWSPMLRQYRPSAVICMGNRSFELLSESMALAGLSALPLSKMSTGCGRTSWASQDFQHHNMVVSVFRLPHFSRSPIFSNPNWNNIATEITRTIFAALAS